MVWLVNGVQQKIEMHSRWMYHSLPIIRPPILHTALSLQRGGGLYSNIQLVLTVCTHKCVDAAKSHDDLPVAIWRNSSTTRIFQVCWYFLEKSGREITWWQETKEDWEVWTYVYIFGGKRRLLCSLSYVKASNQYYKDSQTNLRNSYSVRGYLRYSKRPWGI